MRARLRQTAKRSVSHISRRDALWRTTQEERSGSHLRLDRPRSSEGFSGAGGRSTIRPTLSEVECIAVKCIRHGLQFAKLQHDLASAFTSRGLGDRGLEFIKAIDCFHFGPEHSAASHFKDPFKGFCPLFG